MLKEVKTREIVTVKAEAALLRASVLLTLKRTRSRQNFQKKATDILKAWLVENIDHPYPSDAVKDELSRATNLNRRQIQNWFTNTRKVNFYSEEKCFNFWLLEVRSATEEKARGKQERQW